MNKEVLTKNTNTWKDVVTRGCCDGSILTLSAALVRAYDTKDLPTLYPAFLLLGLVNFVMLPNLREIRSKMRTPVDLS